MRFRLAIAAVLLLSACALGQNTPTAQFFGAGWNHIAPTGTPTQPTPWCAQDSNGTIATLTGFRLWDDGTKWAQVEQTASSPTDTTGYTFSKLDWAMGSNVATKPGCNMHMLYQFGATPAFAAAGTPTNTCSAPTSPANCAPPIDVNGDGTGADAWWLNYVGQIALRYSGKSGSKGQMGYWGIWNEADSPNFWCWSGTVCGGGGNPASSPNVASLKNLVLMAWDARQLTRCIDSTSRMVSPDGHVGTMLTWFSNYVNTVITAPARNITITPPAGSIYAPITCSWSSQTVHGSDTFDIVDEHMRGTSSTNTDPTSVILAWQRAQQEMTVQDPVLASYPLWNDEWGWNGKPPSQPCQVPNVATGAAYTAISLSLMVSFHSPSIQQEYFYQWDNACAAPPSQTIIGLANDVVAGWVINGTVQNYSLTGAVYSIPLTLSGGGSAKIMFDNSKTCPGATISTCATANQSAGSFTSYTDISGTPHSVSGGVVPVGLAPILLTGGGAPTANAPTCSPNGGTFAVNQSVTCSSTSPGAIICTRQDGTSPATNGTTGCAVGSTLYAGAFTISLNETLKAIAGGTGYSDSTVYSAVFAFHGSAPTFSPPAASYNGAQTISLTSPQSQQMCYTTDGSTPTSDGAGNCSHGTHYTVGIVVAASETIKAIGMQSGWTDSPVGSAAYTINYVLSAVVSGLGTVNSSPAGISGCTATGGDCSELYGQGTVVTLTGTAGSGYTFAGWSGGGCSGTSPCAVTVNSTTSVTATFSLISPPITVGRPIGVMLQ